MAKTKGIAKNMKKSPPCFAERDAPHPPPFLIFVIISFQKPALSITTAMKDSSGDVKYHEQVGGSPSVICNQEVSEPHQ